MQFKYYTKKYLSFKVVLRVLLLWTILVPLITPVVLNAKEPLQDMKENVISIEINKENKVANKWSYATNTAYVQSDANSEQGTGIIKTDRNLVNSINYKINAITHEVIIRVELTKDINADDKVFAVEVYDDATFNHEIEIDETNTDADSNPGYIKEISSGAEGYEYEISTGELTSFNTSGKYHIVLKNYLSDKSDYDILELPNDSGVLNIGVPNIVVHNGLTYSMIGDGTNDKTDVDDIIDSDKIEPGNGSNLSSGTKTTTTYGVYELESICYEDANPQGGLYGDEVTTITNPADWGSNDLTLTKYDHVIRPCDGNYLVASNIDASVTNESTPTLDNLGGWSTDGTVNDGYRPIGQKVGTTDGKDYKTFTGQITGDIDIVLEDNKLPNNTVINKLHIYEPELYFVGMIASGDGAKVNNLGIVNPKIEGKVDVGAFLGSATNYPSGNSSELINLYTAQTEDESTGVEYEVIGAGQVGGIVGYFNNSTLISDSNFVGEIPGVDSSLLENQPSSMYPDADGYKTFNTLDVYSKSTGGVGGLVGLELRNSEINSVYNKGDVYADNQNSIGGIVGRVDGSGNTSVIKNVYNYGDVTANQGSYIGGTTSYYGGWTGGIAGYIANTELKNAYNYGNIEGIDCGIIGGIVGLSYSGSTGNPSTISNVYNAGSISGTNIVGGLIGSFRDMNLSNGYSIGTVTLEKQDSEIVQSYVSLGGAIGREWSSDSGSKIENVYANCVIINNEDLENVSPSSDSTLSDDKRIRIGRVYAGDFTTLPGESGRVTKENNYWSSATIVDNSSIALIGAYETNPAQFQEVDILDVKSEEWWNTTLFRDGSDNWNIFPLDANIPSPDSDILDESQDNAEGTVLKGYYPKVKKIDAEGNPTQEEVLEQQNLSIPVPYNVDYKIDARTLDVYLKIETDEATEAIITVNDGTNDVITSTASLIAGPQEIFVQNIGWADGSLTAGKIKPDHDYEINLNSLDNKVSARCFIHTPKQAIYNGETYALIGDEVNSKTDVEDSTVSDKIEPGDGSTLLSGTPTTSNYGIYELESICYEESLGTDVGYMADWSSTDLTLAKYDHIIRPCNGNYMIQGNIDATITNETVMSLDNVGGWSTDANTDGEVDTNDGYRPIGKKLTSDEYVSFTGNLVGKSDGTISTIKNLYINQPDSDFIGLVSFTSSSSKIDRIGIEETDSSIQYIIGRKAVGSIAGTNQGIISNCYSTIDIKGSSTGSDPSTGQGALGGLVGVNTGTISDSYTTGNVTLQGINKFDGGVIGAGGITGLSVSGKIVNCYATGDVESTNYYVGGIVGRSLNTEISNCYTTGNITTNGQKSRGFSIGGIVGQSLQGTSIRNCYATGVITAKEGAAGGITSGNFGDIEISNCYFSGIINVFKGGGGIIDSLAAGGVVNNCYATGEINGVDAGGVASENFGTINNSYSYEKQKVNGVYVKPSNIISIGSKTGVYIATYDQITTASWYSTGSDGTGLGWNSSGTHNGSDLNTGGDVNMDWTAPWMDGSYCMPHVMRDVGAAGNLDNDGTYVQNQPCVPIEDPLIEGAVELLTCKDLDEIGEVSSKPLDGYYVITNDIDCTGYTGFTPNGRSGSPFTGTFDGGDYDITNLKITVSGYGGLFRETSSTAVVKNVNLIDVDITSGMFLGAISGINAGIIDNVYASGKMTIDDDANIGGIAGLNEATGIVTNCYTDIEMTGVHTERIGGIVGYNSGNVLNCIATGDIISANTNVGGLVGYNPGTISDSYATGNITTDLQSTGHGGLVGSNPGTIKNSYATGNINITNKGSNIGGMVGYNYGTVINGYATGNLTVSGDSANVGVALGNSIGSMENIYGYESQTLNGIPLSTVSGSATIVGNNPTYTLKASQDDLKNEGDWYTTTLGFNTVDIDDNGDLTDDSHHWNIENVEAGYYPKINQVTYIDESSTGGGGLTTAGEEKLVKGQDIDEPIVVLKIKQDGEDIDVYLYSDVGIDISTLQKQSNEKSKINTVSNDYMEDELLLDNDSNVALLTSL